MRASEGRELDELFRKLSRETDPPCMEGFSNVRRAAIEASADLISAGRDNAYAAIGDTWPTRFERGNRGARARWK